MDVHKAKGRSTIKKAQGDAKFKENLTKKLRAEGFPQNMVDLLLNFSVN